MTIVAALCLAGCQQDPHQREVSDALVRMMNALDNANWKAFWEEADPESKSQVLTLHQELHDALRLVDDLYERAEQPIARSDPPHRSQCVRRGPPPRIHFSGWVHRTAPHPSRGIYPPAAISQDWSTAPHPIPQEGSTGPHSFLRR